MQQQRIKIIKEIFRTEKDYVQNLEIIIKVRILKSREKKKKHTFANGSREQTKKHADLPHIGLS